MLFLPLEKSTPRSEFIRIRSLIFRSFGRPGILKGGEDKKGLALSGSLSEISAEIPLGCRLPLQHEARLSLSQALSVRVDCSIPCLDKILFIPSH